MKRSIINRQSNNKLDSEPETTTRNRIINDQHDMRVAGFRLGGYSVSYNGCEAIAVHNALLLSGTGSRLSDILGLIEAERYLWFFRNGLWGTDPFKIKKLLRPYGLGCVRVKRRKKINEPGVYIISYFNNGRIFDGVHTVCFSFDGTEYTAYNVPRGTEHLPPDEYAFRRLCCYRIAKGPGCLSKL